jgi:hypothetical protein
MRAARRLAVLVCATVVGLAATGGRAQPPASDRPFRSWLFVPAGDLGKYSIRELGVTDLITNLDPRFTWGTAPDAEVRAEVERLRSKSEGLPLTLFFWCFGDDWAHQNPWAADEANWSRFLAHVRILASLGVKGLILDCEDEGRVARRDPKTGEVTVAWWPPDSRLATRGREFAAAAGGEVAIYATFWMQLQLTGYNGNLNPPEVAADGWFQFCNALPADYRFFAGDTYLATTAAAITATRARIVGAEPRQLARARLVPGTWLEPGEGARLALAAAARETSGEYWIYQDPGALLDESLRAALRAALRK